MTAPAASTSARPRDTRGLYPRWIGANAVAELVGLGGTFALVAVVLPANQALDGAFGVAAGFALLVGSGAVEATVVAWLQHRVMRPWFPAVGLGGWWRATLYGALIAYGLGYLPSTLIDAAEPAGAAPPAEPPLLVTLALAALLGAVAGAVLSAFQARALRGAAVPGAWRWIPANMLAWAAGMPLIFVAMDVAFRQGTPVLVGLVIGGALLLAGAVVGAVHGRTLLRLAEA